MMKLFLETNVGGFAVELRFCVESMLPYHSVTVTAATTLGEGRRVLKNRRAKPSFFGLRIH
jgi:hypothetical protein